jgi:hypothetical protein
MCIQLQNAHYRPCGTVHGSGEASTGVDDPRPAMFAHLDRNDGALDGNDVSPSLTSRATRP